jgi:thiol-disulfide isomerase/thioredoxin
LASHWSRALVLLLSVGPVLPAGARPADTSRTRIADRIRGQRIAAEHPAMESPTVGPAAAAAHMREDDVVLGVVVSGEPRAYPWWIVKHFHVVNDTIGGVPLAVAFCEQCTGAAAFRRELDGRVLSMEVPGVYNGTIILRDRETRTLWAPFSGQALEGPLAGKKLERLPLSLMRWKEWKERHPETSVLWGPEQARGGHGSWYAPGKWGIVGEMGATIESWDPRLPENTLVYGVQVEGTSKSYTLAEIKARRVVNDQLGAIPVVVAAVGDLEVAGFDRRLRDQVLTFSPSPEDAGLMRDRETQSLWSVEGWALGGPLRGQQLAALDGYVVEWHVWSAYNPRAEVIGVAAPPDVPPVGTPAFPALALLPVNGSVPEAVRFTGEVNLVALWASWCPPCRVEMPTLQALARKHSTGGLTVQGIAIHMPDDDPDLDQVRSVLSESGVTFPNRLVDERAYDQLEALARSLGRPGIVLPTVFVVDKQGRVLAVFSGDEVARLPAAVDGYLPLPSPTSPR